MRKLTASVIAGAVLSIAASVSANTTSGSETVVVPVGPATIKVVEIGLPPVNKQTAAATQSGE